MGLSTEQAEAVKRQEIERIPLGRRGHPNDVSRWIISLADPGRRLDYRSGFGCWWRPWSGL